LLSSALERGLRGRMEVLLTRVLIGLTFVPESGPGKSIIGVFRVSGERGHAVDAASRRERERQEAVQAIIFVGWVANSAWPLCSVAVQVALMKMSLQRIGSSQSVTPLVCAYMPEAAAPGHRWLLCK